MLLNVPIIDGQDAQWSQAAAVGIEHYPWDVNGYKPKVVCRIFATEDRFHLMFEAYEETIRAEVVESCSTVCYDSCVEFFFQPSPHADERYLNFELNPLGTLCLGIGTNRYDWTLIKLDDYKELFHIEPAVHESRWTISFQIPFAFIRRYFPGFAIQKGSEIRGNFYKCGDLTDYPHYGCWNQVMHPEPDFHLPEHFGSIVFY